MALFSRRSKNDRSNTADSTGVDAGADASETVEAASAEADATAMPAENVPQVNISVSTFGGLGAAAPAAAPAPPRTVPAPAVRPEELPYAPADPPSNIATVEGLRDNAVLRDALSRLPAEPTGAQLLGIVRQMLQGHVFFRVQGDARELVESGQPLALGVVRDGDRNFLLAFSSGKALQDAVKADENTATSAVGQPAMQMLQHIVDNDFAGLILDNHSAPARAVIPREVLVRAHEQADPTTTLKGLLSEPRSEETVAKVIAALPEARLWVAVGEAENASGEKQLGIAEAHTQSGLRFLQLFTHPLEVIALGRSDRPMPFPFEQVVKALTGDSRLAGVLIDSAGPSIRLEREALTPILTTD